MAQQRPPTGPFRPRLQAAALAVVVLGAVGAAGTADAATARSCAHPRGATLSRGAVSAVLRGTKTSHHPRGGPLISLASSPGEVGRRISVAVADPAWRLCSLSSRPPRTRVPAPTSRPRGRSEIVRKFFGDPTAMRVWYARRDASADGSSCANPFVVYADEFGARGDRFAGTVTLETTGEPGERGSVSGSWEAKPGYVTCSAAGSANGGRPWTDRRPLGDHLLYRFYCCPNTTPSGSNIAYLFASFRRE